MFPLKLDLGGWFFESATQDETKEFQRLNGRVMENVQWFGNGQVYFGPIYSHPNRLAHHYTPDDHLN